MMPRRLVKESMSGTWLKARGRTSGRVFTFLCASLTCKLRDRYVGLVRGQEVAGCCNLTSLAPLIPLVKVYVDRPWRDRDDKLGMPVRGSASPVHLQGRPLF
ncbi:uncharacterized protein LOC100865311 [Apis florea]|uniref:uncharacterized protein LOC100865311 n=1 Tax=Apis florea TaxID=7463 RepID=UPI000629C95A|nr:uncharacterized protein LOC100865311 [Apis florea]